MILSFSHADTINLFPLVAGDGQVCDYRPTSKPHRYYIPIPPLIESMTRCQPLISETTNSAGRRGGGAVTFFKLIDDTSLNEDDLKSRV